MRCDILIVGGGTGGVAAALSLAYKGFNVVLTEETDCLGGQLTSQIVPPDEHPWIEQFGCTESYRSMRNAVRASYLYRKSPKLQPVFANERQLNPGSGWVSRLCAEPMLFAQSFQGLQTLPGLTILLESVPVAAECQDDQVISLTIRSIVTGSETTVEPKFVLDATELGDLLPLTQTEYVVGAESRSETNEPHALDGPADPENIQSFTWCAAVGYDTDGDHRIEQPEEYEFWRSYIPPHWTGPLLDLTFPNVRTGEPMTLPLFGVGSELTLFGYRQIVDPNLYSSPVEPVTVVNWPQNDYMLGHVIDVDASVAQHHYERAKQLTKSVLYWLQTELGFKGLRFRPDITGTQDGLAKAPYHRESRRIKSLRTVTELDVSPECNPGCQVAPEMWDSVGVGAYRIDLHPSTNGAKTIDIGCLPFQIPLGALIPIRAKNLIPACKNIGTTHITNGCYRLHPVEWNIGEVAGHLAAHCLSKGLTPQELYEDKPRVKEFQDVLVRNGIELSWPILRPL